MIDLLTLAAETVPTDPVSLIEKLGVPIGVMVLAFIAIVVLWKRSNKERDEYLTKIEKLHNEKMDIAIKCNDTIKAVTDAMRRDIPPS